MQRKENLKTRVVYCNTHYKCSNIIPRQLTLDKEIFEALTPILPYITECPQGVNGAPL